MLDFLYSGALITSVGFILTGVLAGFAYSAALIISFSIGFGGDSND